MNAPRDRIKSRVLAPLPEEQPDAGLLRAGAAALLLALFGLGAAAWLSLTQDGGADAVAQIAGLAPSVVSVAVPDVLRLALALDFAVLLGYGAGFCLLGAALSYSRARAALAFGIATFTLLGVTFDLVENAMALTGAAAEVYSVVKFGTVGVAAFLLASAFPPNGWGNLVRVVGWVATPLALIAVLAGLPLAQDPLIFALTLGLAFAIVALAAMMTARAIR
ncbi:MAG: hypothetical protein AAFY65_16565 [Pseudomonadota bacterium]